MKNIALSRGDECLSETYVNANTKLQWCCSKGHMWEATPRSIKNGTWCGRCAGKVPLSLEIVQATAHSKGGQCLSETYVDNSTKMKFRCKEGHEWFGTARGIRSGKWCLQCSGRAKGTIEEMRAIAKVRGGECLSEEYGNADAKLKWKCKEGHEWEAPDKVKNQGTWCPVCGNGQYLKQEKCRFIFENLLGKRMVHTRKVLENRLELDGFNKELKLAFEYQGRQHYEFAPEFHRSREGFDHQKERDERKRKQCKQLGICLIEIPFGVHSKVFWNRK